jgi:hypothetical protein
MARTYDVKNLSVPRIIYEALEAKMREEGRLGSFTAYASEILSRYISGTLVSEELLRAKVEAELRKTIGQEAHRSVVDVKAHRPAKENRGAKHKAA